MYVSALDSLQQSFHEIMLVPYEILDILEFNDLDLMIMFPLPNEYNDDPGER